MRKKALLIAFALCGLIQAQSLKQNFDFGWKFCEQDITNAQNPTFDDNAWQSVVLPHDWDIYHAPALDAPSGNDGGYYPGGIGWYRKSFTAPALKAGSRCVLHFEGAYQRSKVYVNGQEAGGHNYGYTPFSLDITSLLQADAPNTVAVRVDNSQQPNCRWYSGSGITRHVWLEVYEQGVKDDPKKLFLRTEKIEGISADGKTAKRATLRISYEGQADEVRTFENVRLWSPEHPELYAIQVGALTVKHGFRTFTYDAQGARLNGQPILINGACVHHDDGVLGAMAYDEAEVRKVRLMKEAGFNLIRTSHNPQTTAMLNACDSLGMLVIDESFDGWYTEKTAHDYHEVIDTDYQQDLAAMVLRDRNHPSIICWSIGNEVIERKEIRVVHTARKFKAAITALDPTRPVTEALCSWDSDWEIFDPHAEVLDIVGYNYMMHKAESDHERCPERVMWQTESYPRDAFKNWQHTLERPYIIGDMVWTGLDYLGESGIGQFYYEDEPRGEHYQSKHFPFHGAYCGDVDITGWRKPISHYRDMLWNVKEGDPNFIYMAVREPEDYHKEGGTISETSWSVWPTWESWTWPGYEGKSMEIEIYSKAPLVRLYLNNEYIGFIKMDRYHDKYTWHVDLLYTPGTLRAVACDASGKACASTTLTTAGQPYAIRLTPEQTTLKANGQDLSYIVMEVVDKQGRVCPKAAIPVDVTVSGAGSLLAAASASFKDLEPKTSPHVTTYKGRAIIVVRSSQKPGNITVTTRSALKPGKTQIANH